MSNLFTAIRDAVRPGSQTHALDIIEGEPGAEALNPAAPLVEANSSGEPMSVNQTLAGAAQPATAALAAVTAAASGGQDGYSKAMDRMTAILSADGIKGDGKRMAAALDLATASPDMAADAVVSFVTANVSASAETHAQAATTPAPAPPASQASTYEQQRLSAAALAMPGGGQSAKAESGLSKAVSARIEALKTR